MTDDDHEFENSQPEDKARRRKITTSLGGAVVGGMLGAGGSIRETLGAVRKARDFAVMVRLNKESLKRLDDLVNCGLVNSRSEAAAFLIAEGAKARADLYDKIAEQSEVIRKAREQMSRLLDDEPNTASSGTGD